jgi:integrase
MLSVSLSVMASLRRRFASKYLFACFTLPDGTRAQRSTKMTDRKAALKLAMQWEEAACRRITESQARRVLSDIHEQIHGARLASPSLADYVMRWLGRKTGETRSVTLTAYKSAVEEFSGFLGDRANQPIHYVTPVDVAAWRDRSAARATPRTANNKLKIVRTLFQSAWRDGLLTDNPAAKVVMLKSAGSKRRPFTIRELQSILLVASLEWRGMVIAGLYTGLRLKDVASLTWANIDLQTDQVAISTSKTDRRQILPIARPLRAYLDTLSVGDDPTAPLFPNAYPFAVRSGGTAVLSQQFYALLVAANLAPARPPKNLAAGKGRNAARERSEITFHSLRHTATSLLKAAGVSESVTRDIIGHESAEISRHYTHVEESAKRAAIDKLPDVTE